MTEKGVGSRTTVGRGRATRRTWPLAVLIALAAAGAFVWAPTRHRPAAGESDRVVLELTPDGAGGTARGARPGRMATVLVVARPGEDVTVPVVVTNPSDRVVRYPWAYGELALLSGSLYRDGEMVKAGRVRCDRRPLTKDQVKELQPGESVTTRYTLPYVRVRPGEYELRLQYRVYPGSVLETEFGLTPMLLEHAVRLDVRRL